MGHCICIMNHGSVVQIGRPLDVYRNPADTFVARFLGNPPMNLLKATLDTQNGRAVARIGAIVVPLTASGAPARAQYVGRDVLVGIRPEDLYEHLPPGVTQVARLPASVVAVEPLGAETLLVVSLQASGEELIARIGRDTQLCMGDRLDVALDAAAIHLFDPATTKAIV